jgi:hypothetical protein
VLDSSIRWEMQQDYINAKVRAVALCYIPWCCCHVVVA